MQHFILNSKGLGTCSDSLQLTIITPHCYNEAVAFCMLLKSPSCHLVRFTTLLSSVFSTTFRKVATSMILSPHLRLAQISSTLLGHSIISINLAHLQIAKFCNFVILSLILSHHYNFVIIKLIFYAGVICNYQLDSFLVM